LSRGERLRLVILVDIVFVIGIDAENPTYGFLGAAAKRVVDQAALVTHGIAFPSRARTR
jgi:hypothetical protein